VSVVALGGDGRDIGFVEDVSINAGGGTGGIGDEGKYLRGVGTGILVGSGASGTCGGTRAPSGGIDVSATDMDTIGFGADSV